MPTGGEAALYPHCLKRLKVGGGPQPQQPHQLQHPFGTSREPVLKQRTRVSAPHEADTQNAAGPSEQEKLSVLTHPSHSGVAPSSVMTTVPPPPPPPSPATTTPSMNLRVLMMAQTVGKNPPFSPRGGGTHPGGMMDDDGGFTDSGEDDPQIPTPWPANPAHYHHNQGIQNQYVPPLRAEMSKESLELRTRNHEWYQSLTVGTLYSLVYGLRFEDSRLPSPRISLLEEVFRLCPQLRLKILEAVTQTSFEWMATMKELTHHHVSAERDLQAIMSRDHGVGLAELLNSIISFIREDLGVASPLPCPTDDLLSNFDDSDDDDDDEDLSDDSDEEDEEERQAMDLVEQEIEALARRSRQQLQQHCQAQRMTSVASAASSVLRPMQQAPPHHGPSPSSPQCAGGGVTGSMPPPSQQLPPSPPAGPSFIPFGGLPLNQMPPLYQAIDITRMPPKLSHQLSSIRGAIPPLPPPPPSSPLPPLPPPPSPSSSCSSAEAATPATSATITIFHQQPPSPHEPATLILPPPSVSMLPPPPSPPPPPTAAALYEDAGTTLTSSCSSLSLASTESSPQPSSSQPPQHEERGNWAENAALLREGVKALSILLRGHANKLNNPSTDKAECAHLRECLIEVISAYPPTALRIVDILLRVWPTGNSTRESSFLHLLTLVLSCSPLSVFLMDDTKTHVKAFKRVCRCVQSSHAGVAEEALAACSNPRIIARYMTRLAPPPPSPSPPQSLDEGDGDDDDDEEDQQSGASSTTNSATSREIHAMVCAALRDNQATHWHPDIRYQSEKLADGLEAC